MGHIITVRDIVEVTYTNIRGEEKRKRERERDRDGNRER